MTITLSPTVEAQSTARRMAALPPTQMDSFVHEAGIHAEHIYGDESWKGPPPYESFSEAHRIDTGILDTRDAGLTTGHGSYMPDAVGRDEFLGQEWSNSGYQNVGLANGFYAGVPYKVAGVGALLAQFPGGFDTLEWIYRLDETRMRDVPLPELWNQENPDMPQWVRQPNGTWKNSLGDILYATGVIQYFGNPEYPPGTYILRDGTVVYPPRKSKN